ncbi:MAG: Bug family tripartite tricarboxylate transporter substrate binding protein [Gemmatimonas sp.]
MNKTAGTISVALCLGLATAAVNAQAPAEGFYKGKVVTVIVGNPPGGGFDAYARLFAAHVGRHLPGNPTVIVQNMPGASTITATLHLYGNAPRDGTVVLMNQSTAVFAPIFGNTSTPYKPTDFTWIGNFDQATGTCAVWEGSGIRSFDDMLKTRTIVGASAPTGVASEYARAMNALFGTQIRVIHGYGSTGGMLLAMQRGEVQGSCGFMLSSLESVYRNEYASGKLTPVVQFAHKSDKLKGVPHILDFARTDEDRAVFNLTFGRDVMGRPLLGPPGLAPERTAQLRAAFDAVVADPAFREAADRAKLPLVPMSGAEVEAFVRDMVATPPAAVARASAALAFGAKDNEQLKSLDGRIARIADTAVEVEGGPSLRIRSEGSMIMLHGEKAEAAALAPGMACSFRYDAETRLVQTVSCN